MFVCLEVEHFRRSFIWVFIFVDLANAGVTNEFIAFNLC